nr:hypothetical protein [Lachnospiraceae bacterium]
LLTEKTDYTVSWKNNKEVGTATVTVKFKGNYKDAKSETVCFRIEPAVLGEDIIAHEIGVAAKKKGSVKVTPVLTWAETGKSVSSKYFTINPSSVTGEGTTSANISSKGGQKNYAGTATVMIKAVGDKNKLLNNAKVKLDKKSYAYTGSAITPAYELKLGGKTLAEGTDYKRVSLKNNVSPGTATIIFEAVSTNGAGIVGTKSATFKISGKKALKEAGSGSPYTYSYDKKPAFTKGGAKPFVTVYDGDTGYELQKGKDYTLSYKKNKAVTSGETAEVKVKGKGNYKGTVTLKFAIAQQSLKAEGISIIADDQFTTRSRLKAPKVTITDVDGKKLKLNKDYTVGTPDTSAVGNTEESGEIYITLTGKGSYTGEAKASFRYMNTASANIARAKTVKKIADQDYTGNRIRLSANDLSGVLSVGAAKLEPGKDFIVAGYANNIKKGTAKVILQGTGPYAGTKTLTFKIVQRKVDYQGALIGEEWK